MNVLVTEKIAPEGIQALEVQGFSVDIRLGLPREQLLAAISDYEALIVRSVTQVDQKLLQAAARLRVVGRAGNGVDNIDLEAATERGIVVVNTPESNTMAAAELAVGMAFCLFRNLPQAVSKGRQGDFRRSHWIGQELNGKTVGIIGLGRIGSIVAARLKGCGMHVLAYDPYITDERFRSVGVEKCEHLTQLLENADLITIHTPKTAETYGMLGADELARCKTGVRLINAARGGLINQEALQAALTSGQVSAAALDVLEPEPSYDKAPEEQDYHHPLLDLDHVLVTPHLGASTAEAGYNVSTAVAELVIGALQGEMVAAVNMPAVPAEDMAELRPYLTLAESLGKIYYQTEPGTVEKLEVIVNGDLADKETGLISLSALKGFLEPIIEEKVNYVNAEFLVRNMGIEFVESRSSTYLDTYTNLIRVRFTTKEKQLSVAGTVLAKGELRIVDFFGYKLNFEPAPFILAVQNRDRPGLIGRIGTILGARDINIDAMQWSRNRKGNRAVSFLSIDREIDETILDQLRGINGVLRASLIRL